MEPARRLEIVQIAPREQDLHDDLPVRSGRGSIPIGSLVISLQMLNHLERDTGVCILRGLHPWRAQLRDCVQTVWGFGAG